VNCIGSRRFFHLCLAISAVSFCGRTLAQAEESPQAAYRSESDDLISLDKVSVLPFTDNLQGIYARPLEAHLVSLINGMHRWDFVPASTAGPILSPEELENSPEKARDASRGLGADGFFAGRVSKGPLGVTIHLSLFLSKDGKLISQAILKDYKRFDLNDLKEQMQRLLSEIVVRLPYAGRVLSREGNRVTINLGAKDGLQANQLLSVVQIIQLQRHPKFNFLVKSEKEILGRIKVLKVDETLSFGMVVTEKERNAIQRNAKIGSLDYVSYGSAQDLTPGPEDALSQREDSAIAFGKDARPWQPQSSPSFGQIGGRLGLSRFHRSTDLGGVGALEGSNAFAPLVQLDGELWITPQFTVAARLKQGVISISNPRAGSSPSELGQSLGYYEMSFGYRARLGPYVWSAHVEPYLGYFNYKLFVDGANPEAFTTMQYSGIKVGVRGSTPIGGERGLYGVGGEFAMAFRPGLKETPVTTGASSENNVTQFGIFGFKKLGERLKVIGSLDFEMYSSNFSGAGTRAESGSSSSHRFVIISGGVAYMF
jgi:hypothetical protein